MSYHRKRYARSGLGATPSPTAATAAATAAAQAKLLSQTFGGAAAALVDIGSLLSSDPALPEVACVGQQLYALENRKPVVPCPRFPLSNRPGGLGLRKAVPAMRAWVFAEQNPWVKPVAVATVVGIPFLLGYLLGGRK